MEKITPISIEKNKAIVEIYGEQHKIKNPKHGQILEFYGQKYELDLKPAKNEKGNTKNEEK